MIKFLKSKSSAIIGSFFIMFSPTIYAQTNFCDSLAPINNGLIACYPFDSSTNDESGHSNNGTPANLNYTTDRFGAASKAGLFNSASPSNSNITNVAFKVNQFTYSMWVNVPTLPASGKYYSAISIGDALTDQAILLGNNSGPKHIGFGLAIYNSDLSSVSGLNYVGSLPLINTWYHLAVVRSNTTVDFYVNGVLISTASTAGKTPGYGSASYTAYIGTRGGTIQHFNGKIDDVKIYNRALSNSEIISLYNATNTGLSQTDEILKDIKIFPNPAQDDITIDNGNYSQVSNYSIMIVNTLGQSVFKHQIDRPQFKINTNDFGARGIFFVQILDLNNQVVETRKLILR